MIEYERSSWWQTCFSLHGTVLPRVLARVGLLTGFALIVTLLDHSWLRPQGYPLPALDPLGHNVLGVALGLLIVFRTNNSNNRYWDARGHWGMLLNTARNLARIAAVYAGHAEELSRLLAAYVIAVKLNLRGDTDLSKLRPLLPGRVLDKLKDVNNPPSLLAKEMSVWVAARVKEGRLSELQAFRLEELICVLLDQQGACEKIRKTPLPFVYASLIKQILLLYLVTLPFVLIEKMGFAAPLVVAVVSLGIMGIEEAGVEIEEPFGSDPNDLPLETFCAGIARDAAELTKED